MSTPPVVLCCAPDNDLYKTLRSSGLPCRRYATATEAIAKAPEKASVLLLPQGDPAQRTAIDGSLLARVRDKGLKLYVEFPEAIPGIVSAQTQQTVWERVVVTSDAFGSALPRLRILMLPRSTFVVAPAQKPLLSLARVAGFDTAGFGLPDQTFPLLFEAPEQNVLVATAPLSAFHRGRYGPAADWRIVWQKILALLDPERSSVELTWRPAVHPAYGPDAKLPRDVERRALKTGVAWYLRSGLLLSEARYGEVAALLRANQSAVPPGAQASGDGTRGILEGFASTINPDGRQDHLLGLRADCNAETAMVFALDWRVNQTKASRDTAQKLADFTVATFQSGVRGDPRHPAYGLIAWGAIAPAWEVANYGDDNARALLGLIATAACLETDRWNASLLKALLANLRTTGTLGFRGDRIDIPALEQRGWRAYYDQATVNYAPAFESYLWACYLWAYRQTKHAPFLERTRTAIRRTMQVYPGQWRWKDSMERARMLLCLAWLVRVEDTPEHRQWLATVATDLLKTQHRSGALREQFGGGGGHYHAPDSNGAYGTGEAPLVQRDGDPVTDQLYTTGFALLGLHEAVAVTRDSALKEAEDRLAAYLCRVQVRSDRYPAVDGAWFRAFDFQRWDYWASAADAGWGPWNAESGWGPAWINAVLALRQRRQSFWDLTATVRLADSLAAAQAQMALNDGSPLR